MLRRLSIIIALALGLSACGGGGGGGGGSNSPPPVAVDPGILADATIYSAASSDALPSALEAAAVTTHNINLPSGTLAYTATVGHLNAGLPVKASMFYVAYTADGASNRPIIFFYNGGPGSASLWLHLGSWGPQRLVTHNPATNIALSPIPVDNPQTLLALADLVFVDAVGTGYSEAVAPNSNRTFWGVDADAAVFRDFVLRYTAKTGRTAAPLVLFGESYGGLRTPILAQALLAAGAPLQGVILQSAILNYNSNCAVLDPGRLGCGAFIPSYGATAAWFQLAKPQPSDLPSFAQGVIDYVAITYEPAAQAWLGTHLPLAVSINQQLADYTGLPSASWQANPLLGPDAFRRSLLAGQLLGRYDTRVNAPNGSTLASEGDPSSTIITATFRAAIATQLQQLKYQAAVAYTLSNNAAINQWDWQHDGKALPDAIPDLALALTLKPGLKLMVIGGYHDLATPFRLTELDLARLGSAPAGLTTKRYTGGHMTYLDDSVRPTLAADLTAWLKGL